MKKIFKFAGVAVVTLLVATGCVKEDDSVLPLLKVPFFSETFDDAENNTILNTEGWINFAEKGTVVWKEKVYRGDGYAEFNTYGSGDAENIGWLMSPAIDISHSKNPKFSFQSSQNFVSSPENTVYVYVVTSFNGTNYAEAQWHLVNAIIADQNTEGYLFIHSGEIDLAPFKNSGTIRIAFKGVGSGTNTNLDGLFQINNVNVYNLK